MNTNPMVEGQVKEKQLALSIRQPWAYLILHGSKRVENRSWPTKVRGRVLIHASQTMTRADYEACVIFCSGLPAGTLTEDFKFPTFEELRPQCGGMAGAMRIVDCVTQSDSPWFCGEYGFVISSVTHLPFERCKGRLGFFRV